MTVWVVRNGQLVDKATVQCSQELRSNLPSPRVSRFETMESPVTGKDVSSWRQRDADMKAVDAIDTRDLPNGHKFSKGREAQFNDAGRSRPAEWGGLD